MQRSVFEAKWLPFAFAAPQLLLVVLFFYWPAAQALSWSLRLERPFGGPSAFVGFENFVELFADDVFLKSLISSAVFMLSSSLLSVAAALALAVAAAECRGWAKGLGTTLIWPYAVAAPAAGVIIALILDPHFGLAAFLNDWQPGLWSPTLNGSDAMIMVVVAFMWLHIPFNFVFLAAGLATLSQDCLEAAALDGAGPWRRLFTVKLPLLAPYLLFVMVLDVTESFTQSFGIIDATTQGGPGGATNVLVYNIYSDGFVGLDFSRASAESVLMIAMMAGLAALQFHLLRSRIRRGE